MDMALLNMKSATKAFRPWLLAIIFGWGALAGVGQTPSVFPRTIVGVVVDKENNPVEGANVCAWGTRPMSGRVPCGKSSPNGGFAVNVHVPDTYSLNAEHFEKGYPEAIWAFYGKIFAHSAVITVDETTPLSPVRITLGPKAGRLLLTILDGETNKPIEEGAITFCRIDEPTWCSSMSTAFPNGHYEVLTPEVAFTIKFQTWHGEWVPRSAFGEAGAPIGAVQVDLGARREMIIRLD
jgi:hypothetical protein